MAASFKIGRDIANSRNAIFLIPRVLSNGGSGWDRTTGLGLMMPLLYR